MIQSFKERIGDSLDEWFHAKECKWAKKKAEKKSGYLSQNISELEKAISSFQYQKKEFDPVWSILALQDLHTRYIICCEQLASIEATAELVSPSVVMSRNFYVSVQIYEQSSKGPWLKLLDPKKPRTSINNQQILEVHENYLRLLDIIGSLRYHIVNETQKLSETPQQEKMLKEKMLRAENMSRPYVSAYEEVPRRITLPEKLRNYIRERKLTKDERNTPRGYWRIRMKSGIW